MYAPKSLTGWVGTGIVVLLLIVLAYWYFTSKAKQKRLERIRAQLETMYGAGRPLSHPAGTRSPEPTRTAGFSNLEAAAEYPVSDGVEIAASWVRSQGMAGRHHLMQVVTVQADILAEVR